MANTGAEHLALVNSVISKRLAGDAYEGYSEAEAKFNGTPLSELYKIRTQLTQEVAASTGGCFRLPEIHDI